jgi:hypothetical protein
VNRSVSLPNSFFLTFANNGSSSQTLNLFNLGENGTSITNEKLLSTILNLDISALVDASGNVLANTTFKIEDSSSNIISSAILTTGQNIFTAYPTAVNPITDLNGNSGTLVISPTQISNKIVNVAVSKADAYLLQVSSGLGVVTENFVQTISTYVTTNPLVTIKGTIPYTEIKQSETGNVYKVVATDFFSTNSSQILEPINYGYKDARGNRARKQAIPIVDPNALGISIQNVDTEGLLLYALTIFEYRVLAYSSIRMTFNYVRAQLSKMLEYEQALSSELLFATDKLKDLLLLNNGREYILYQ